MKSSTITSICFWENSATRNNHRSPARNSYHHFSSLAFLLLVAFGVMLLVAGCGGMSPDLKPGIKPFWTYDTDSIGGGGSIYVNVSGGNLLYQETDLSIPGRGLPVEFRRTYNACSLEENGGFGKGWTHTFNVYLTPQSPNHKIMTLTDAYGGKYVFTNPVNIGQGVKLYKAPPGRNTLLCRHPGGTFTEKKKNGTIYQFDKNGRLTRIQHRAVKNYIDLVYDRAGRLTQIKEASGRITRITYSGGAGRTIASITDPAGRVTAFTYTRGNLTRVTDPEGDTLTYGYTTVGPTQWPVLTSIKNPRGYTTTITYNNQGQVSSFNDPLYTVSYAYNNGNTVVTDTYGHKLTYTLAPAGNVTRIDDTMGFHSSFDWDDNMNITKATDERGKVTTFTYDNRGNPLTSSNPLYSTSATYDNANNVTSSTDGKGKTTTYTYTTNSNFPEGVLNEVRSPMGRTATFTYDEFGQPLTVTDPKGNTTSYQWNTNGNVIDVRDALGNHTGVLYDDIGQALKITDAQRFETNFAYYKNGLVQSVTTPSRAVTAFTYDENGNKLTVTDACQKVTSYVYDADDHLIQVTNAMGHKTKYTYEKGNLISTVDPKGFTTTMTYDANDRMTSRQNPITSEDFTYDETDNILKKETALGDITYTYDDINRVAAANFSGRQVDYHYDDNNNLVRATVTPGSSMWDVATSETEYRYDDDNQRVQTRKAINGYDVETTTYQYDKNGNLTNLGLTIGHQLPPYTAQPITTTHIEYTYEYDDLNRQTKVTNSRGEVFTAEYDTLGNMTALRYPDNSSSTRQFDSEQRIAKVTNMTGDTTTFDYTYDAVGNFKTVRKEPATPWTAGPSAYEYDDLHRLTYDGANQVRYTYDAAGNKLSNMYSGGQGTTTFRYNEAHQLLGTAPDPSLGLHETVYEYDGNGNRVHEYDPEDIFAPQTFAQFDAANRLTSVHETLALDAPMNMSEAGLKTSGAAASQKTKDQAVRRTVARTSRTLSTMGSSALGIIPIPMDWQSEERSTYDGANELFCGQKRYYQGASPDLNTDYHFETTQYGYEGGVLLYRQAKCGYRDLYALVDENSLEYKMEFYTYLNGIKVGLTPVNLYPADSPVPIEERGPQPSFYFLCDGQGNEVYVGNRLFEMPYSQYVFESYGVGNEFESGGYGAPAPSYQGYDKGPFGYKCGVRHYDPSSGVFVSPDAFKGYLDDPMSQHPYMYCRGNPVRYSDPSGYQAVEALPQPTEIQRLLAGATPLIPYLGPAAPLAGAAAFITVYYTCTEAGQADWRVLNVQTAQELKRAQNLLRKGKDKDKSKKAEKEKTDRLIKDAQINPENWEKVDEKSEPSPKKNQTSKRELWRNKKNKEELTKHILEDSKGNPINDSHTHPHWSPRSKW